MSPERERRRSGGRPRRRGAAAPAAVSSPLPPPPATSTGRARPDRLRTWIVLLAGVWVGRAFRLLPDGLEDVAGVVLAMASAVLLTVAYRRWARAQMDRARARRASKTGER